MTEAPLLTISIVTMNRAEQLKEALESCLVCTLPQCTEFVIIDNMSIDNTEEIVSSTLGKTRYSFYYEKLSENIGCGGGRNYAFLKARGTYIYVLDDDAVIDENNLDFFTRAISIMDMHPEIITLTTQIYDTAWGRNRLLENGVRYEDGLYKIKMFCGGSHFLRRDFFGEPPYLSNIYGFEEIPPSLKILDAGKMNIFASGLRVIHKPIVNKWDYSNVENNSLLIQECAMNFALKKMMYPRISIPILWVAYRARCKKHLSKIVGGKSQADVIAENMIGQHFIDYRISSKTLVRLWRDFGVSVF